MIRKEHNGVVWLEFELLTDIIDIKHGIFLRHGGRSKGDYHSLNISFDVGDVAADVKANISLIKEALDIPHITWAVQCHGKTILPSEIVSPSSPCDALHTNKRNQGLMIKHADCQAAVIYDPIHHAIANVHAGWRGSVQNIYSSTIEAMKNTYGSHPTDLLVGISPSLGPRSAEFIHYKQELPQEFHTFQIKPNYFDFWEISRHQLQSCGVLPQHIEIAQIDTYANPSDYFSFRQNKTTGRHGTVIAMR
jgi:polyphenol oxidase